jgi:hypothetical protein
MSTPARQWFQLHLSTALVLMILGSVLLYANFHARQFDLVSERHTSNVTTKLSVYGFPESIYTSRSEVWVVRLNDSSVNVPQDSATWLLRGVVINSTFATVLMTITAIAMELGNRKRKGGNVHR